MTKTSQVMLAAGVAALPLLLYANSGTALTPPLKRTGAAADGGLNCTACHTGAAANSDPRGKLTILATNYTPGRKQDIKVRLEHPDAMRWGFQLTARALNDETKSAGVFTQTDEVNVRCDDGSVRGVPGPCDGRLEFASHTAASTRAGTRTSVEWNVEWTPPASEAGDIVLYAAGNAANNSGTNAGDLIFTTSLRIRAEGACPLTQRPTLRNVVNGASFQPGAGLNSFISIYGLGFAEPAARRQAGAGDIREGRFPTELACVAVEIGGQRAPVLYVQGDQINAQAPTLADRGPVEVRVILNPGRPNEMRSDVGTVQFAEFSPAFFTFDGTRAAAIHADGALVGDPARMQGARPAQPGETITLFGTGFGVTEPVYQAGEIPMAPARLRDPFTVTIGGLTLAAGEVTYAGLSPQSLSALYQFNVRIPATAPDGDVPLSAATGGVRTQSGVVIAVKRPQ
ncbi:MAG: hypothetical protein HY822_09535 [Acidobacteria bacterium]|nr:hypothetical protein [Acidobacteriota bacterium]